MKLGNVWTAGAKIQRINGEKWETLAECMDTPNAIKVEAQKLIKKGFDKGTLWVAGQASGRKMVGDLW